MSVVMNLQGWIALVLGVGCLVLEVWAFVDAVRRRPDAFVAAGKRTKPFWLAVLGVCALVGFVFLSQVGSMLGLVAVAGAGIYLADVKPALDQVTGRGRGSDRGPYGPW